MRQFNSLLSPFSLRRITFRNRLLSTAHAPGYAVNGKPGERYQAYHEEKAKGGIGLTIFGGSSNISRESGSIYGQIYVGSDEIIPVFREFAKRIHKHDTRLMCQITHMGRRTSWAGGEWLPTVGPSAIRDPAHHSVPCEMSPRDIARTVEAFASAAWRCREGGLDGCEVLATTHLLGQFISPLSNIRKDNYGGSLENRSRFLLEVLEAVRQRVGDEFIVGTRIVADESNEGGMSAAEGLELARLVGKLGAVDFINVNGAYGGTLHGLAETFPGMAFKSAPFIAFARAMRQASGVPVFQAARLSDPATADWAIREGYLDMAGLTRPHIADPHIGRKLERGEESRIRPCVGAGYCLDRIYGGRETFCTHNVSTGRELTLPHSIAKADVSKSVVIIGGGPAGMEAARVSALRGHRVRLFEAGQKLGGQILLAARAGWRKDMISIAEWLAQEIAHLGVDVQMSTFIDGPEVLDQKPDVVIVATGGVPDTRLAEGDADTVTTTWQLLSGDVQAAKEVLIYDETGSHGALSTADWLAGTGVHVDLLTPDQHVGRDIGGQNLPVYLRNLYRHGATFTPNHRLLSIRQEGNALKAVFWNEFSRTRIERKAVQIVVDRGTLPADAPYKAMKPMSKNLGETDIEALAQLLPQSATANPSGKFSLFRVGDAVASRDIHAAMLDANRLCRAI